MNFYIAPIVEGQTEQKCIERLLQRVWRELLNRPERLQVLQPFRGKRDLLIGADSVTFSACVQKAFQKLKEKRSRESDARLLVLVLLDAEDDCPATLAPSLLQAARKARSDANIACVLPKKMLENWIVAGASTLAGVNGLPNPLPTRDQFEDRSGVAWIVKQMQAQNRIRAYKKAVDAKVFVQSLDLAECRQNSPSFDKLCRDLEQWSSQ